MGASTGMLSAGPPTPYSLEVRSMGTVKRRGPGPSSLLVTPDHAGNVVGIDPHKRTLSATVADARGGILGSAHFRVSGEGHRELEASTRQFGQIARRGIVGAASWGRHTAMFLAGRGHDVRDVCRCPTVADSYGNTGGGAPRPWPEAAMTDDRTMTGAPGAAGAAMGGGARVEARC